jgi:hypothetical protein
LYKQSQFPPSRSEGQVLGGKRVMMNRTRKRPRRNKANFRPDGSSQGPARPPVRPTVPIASNKANLPWSRGKIKVLGCKGQRSQAGTPNPRSGRGRAPRRDRLRRQYERAGDAGASAPNKPNLRRAGRRRRPLSGPADGDNRAKQTQFAPHRPEKALAERAASAAAAGNKRAKQSQCAPERCEGQVLCVKRVITNWTCQGLGQNKANFWGQADAMDLESAAVCRPHPTRWPPDAAVPKRRAGGYNPS